MADMILLGLAVICTAYFMIIVFYAGMGTSFAFIWLFFAALCVFLVYGKWYYRKNMDRIPRWVPVSIVTTCIAGVVIMAVFCILVFMGAAANEERDLDYVIVLGARVKEHTVSNSLKKRLDKAIEYAEKNPETYLVLSGGKGPDEPVSEAQAMYRYLVYNGVRPGQLLLEEHSVSTVENLAYSKLLIESHREMIRHEREERNHLKFSREPKENYLIAADKPLEVGVLTSNFHVYRACMIAKNGVLKMSTASVHSQIRCFLSIYAYVNVHP